MTGATSGDRGVFAEWQPRYAQHRVATFPVQIIGNDKKPCTKGYLKTGLRGSAQLALKFAEARSFGFACGPRNRLTIVDMDDTDPAIIGEGEHLFGCSPLLWRTGGGKFAMPFRHNGEDRRIRPIRSLPIDLLGGGFAVAPPSAGATMAYEIIRGTLADLDRLPVARIPDEIAKLMPAGDRIGLIPKGERNNELFKHCRVIVDHCDTIDQLIDAATTWADDRLAAPLSAPEIIKTCNSVWQYRGGRKRIMNQIVEAPEYGALVANVGALALFAYLSAENGPGAEFMIADGLSKARGWPRRFVPAARETLLDLGLVELIRAAGKNAPALYRWKNLDIPDLVGNP
jgi:Primase C terminal 1 (PriCT-1)